MTIKEFYYAKPSNLRLESSVQIHFPEEYVKMQEWISNKGYSELPWPERIYLYINQQEYPLCKTCLKNKTAFKGKSNGYLNFCSTSCSKKNEQTTLKYKSSLLEKYGTTDIVNSDRVKNIKKQKNLEKYGVEFYAQSQEFKDKLAQHNLEKYGTEHYFQTEAFKNDVKKSNLEKYGCESTNSLQHVKDKKLKSFMPKMNETLEKMKKTFIEKYGADNPQKNKDIKRKTSISYSKTKRKQRIEKYTLNDNAVFIDYLLNYDRIKYECKVCSNEFIITHQTWRHRNSKHEQLCTVCNPMKTYTQSQNQLMEWISSVYSNSIINNSKNVLPQYEIDLYFPELQLGIEYNGVYWHNETHKKPLYHMLKSKYFNNVGVKLMHLWEDDWILKMDICKSIISYRLGLITQKIYAKKCICVLIEDSEVVFKFMNSNHLQGVCKYTIAYGLYYNDVLVSVMLFRDDLNGNYVIVRYCSIINHVVVGGCSKIFNTFIKVYECRTVKGYCDSDLFVGKMYEKLGFNMTKKLMPQYFWVKDLVREHKNKYTMEKLISMGHDPNSNVVDIMHSLDYYRAYNSGLTMWTKTIN